MKTYKYPLNNIFLNNFGIKIFILIFLFNFFFDSLVLSQNETKQLSLPEVIQLALNQSPEAFLAKHRFRASYWQYRTFKAQFLPSLSLNTNLLDLNRSISKITLENGNDAFVERKINNSSASLFLNQNIGLTGGKFFISSQLQRIDILGDSIVTSYLSSPISVGFTQPLFSYNSFKWEKKIEPLRFEEAKKQYLVDMENVAQKAVNLFFELALAQLNIQIAEANYSNNDTLYQITKGRYNIGTIARNELLEMELTYLTSKSSLKQSYIDLEVSKFRLRSFLGYNEKVRFQILISNDIPNFEIDVQKAIDLAKANNPQMYEQKRQLIEAERDVSRVLSENRFNANLYASYGLTQSTDDLKNMYQNPSGQQQVQIGIEIPLIDWGLGKGRYLMAKSNKEVVAITVKQAETDFEQEIFLKVTQFNMLAEQLAMVAKSDTIAQTRYEVTKQRFMIGKIDVLNLNMASAQKDVSKRQYISSLQNYWLYVYNIRKATLYDFEKDKPIEQDFNKLLE